MRYFLSYYDLFLDCLVNKMRRIKVYEDFVFDYFLLVLKMYIIFNGDDIFLY